MSNPHEVLFRSDFMSRPSETVIDAPTRAPSGDNLQPWLFVVEAEKVATSASEGLVDVESIAANLPLGYHDKSQNFVASP